MMIVHCIMDPRSALLVLLSLHAAHSLRCHQCISRNGDNASCEAPSPQLVQECFPTDGYRVGRQERSRFCYTLRSTSGTYRRLLSTESLLRHVESWFPGSTEGTQVLVRSCTSVRPPDCGVVRFRGESVRGCAQVCSHDGCNSEKSSQTSVYSIPKNQYQSYGGTDLPRQQENGSKRSNTRSIIKFGEMLVYLLTMHFQSNGKR